MSFDITLKLYIRLFQLDFILRKIIKILLAKIDSIQLFANNKTKSIEFDKNSYSQKHAVSITLYLREFFFCTERILFLIGLQNLRY